MKSLFGLVVVAASLVGLHAQEIYKVGNGVVAPVPIKEVRPEYTAEARKARIEGVVDLNVVVLADGTVRDVTVSRSLDSTFGLDQQAVNAAKEWRFKPAARDGKPVAVSVTLQMNFTLK
jgi:TonB family protein